MTRVLFVRRPGVYLPEIPAYCTYLRDHLPGVEAVDSATLGHAPDPTGFEVVWQFMGLDRTRLPDRVELVHEYGSLSTGRLPHVKDRLKRRLNVRPARRVFLNEAVRAGFGFTDTVPWRLRDMGVDDAFFAAPRQPEHDFVYAGMLQRPGVLPYLKQLVEDHPRFSFLLIGEAPAGLRQQLGKRGNVHWTGRVSYADMPALLGSARFALNLMPDRHPFNVQTATKVLEYCAVGLPVLSTRYAWVEDFAAARGARFGWLPPPGKPAALDALVRGEFSTPAVDDLRWTEVIRRAGVFEFMGTRTPAGQI